MWNDRYQFRLADVAALDPLTALTVGATLAGGALSAGGTLAAGSAARQVGQMQQGAANFQAAQIDSNAGQAIAAAQRKAMDTEAQTRAAISRSTAISAASGVDAGAGSAVTNVGDLAKRGSYQAAMDLFNGKSMASGLLNEAAGVRYGGQIAVAEGEAKQQASYLAAGGQALSSAGSAGKTYFGLGPRAPASPPPSLGL